MLAITAPSQQIITAPRHHANMDPLAWLQYFNPQAAIQRVIDHVETLTSSRNERHTMKAYLGSLAAFCAFSGAHVLHTGGEDYTFNFENMHMPTASLVMDYIASLKKAGRSSNTATRYMSPIRHFLRALYEQDVYAQSAEELFLIPNMQRQFSLAIGVKNPAQDVTSNRPALEQHGKRLNLQQVNQLFESFQDKIDKLSGKRDLAIIYLGITSGLRAAEIARVTLLSITQGKDCYEIRVRGKRNNHDPIGIDSTAYNLIMDFVTAWNAKLAADDPRRITNETPVFQPLMSGSHIPEIGTHKYDPARGLSARAILKIVERRTEAALDQPITAHDMRRTCAALMRSHGFDIKTISSQLRHRSSATTDKYIGQEQDLSRSLLSKRISFTIPQES